VTVADDADGLARAITDLLEDAERAARLARAGRARVEEAYSWEAVARRLEDTFRELTDER
jgi:glycosyltransferase involved in cell wall biosynthesis